MFRVGAQKPEHDDLVGTHELRTQRQLVSGSLADGGRWWASVRLSLSHLAMARSLAVS